jgi:hypothetical protein
LIAWDIEKRTMVSVMKKRRTVKKRRGREEKWEKKQEPGSDKVRKSAGQGVGVENGICCFRWDGLN